jgi:hypothetical protein
MSPEDQSAFERLAQAEKVIKLLETLVAECDGQGIDPIVARIKSCIELCQSDYVALQRDLYRQSSNGGRRPPRTKH